jgi:hypothetical protein
MEILNKTLIGKNGYLFLQNDSNKELLIHNDNLCLVDVRNLDNYAPILNKFLMVVFPDKSFFCKDHLPDGYTMIFRPGFNVYKQKLGDRILDGVEILKGHNDVFYKTDTHMNLKGTYMIYVSFINEINRLFSLGVSLKRATVNSANVDSLTNLGNGLGDLTWSQNLGNQTLTETEDILFMSDDIDQIYITHEFAKNDTIRLLLFKQDHILDDTDNHLGEKLDWMIVSKYILHKYNARSPKYKVVIFYDSFLLSTLSLYLNMTSEVYMIKSTFNKNLVQYLKPDYVFEFRVERFLV